jgi:hypothetical protein
MIAACGVLVLSAAPNASSNNDPYIGSAKFERIKKLAGKWIGPDPRKNRDNNIVQYEILSGGRAVLEKIYSGTPEEMISIYFDDKDGKLNLIHFGMLPNPSPLEFRFEKGNTFNFLLPIGSGIKPSDTHIHEFMVTFVDDDHIVQHWSFFMEGRQTDVTVMGLARIQDVRVPDKKETRRAAKLKKDNMKAEAKEAARRAKEIEKARKEEEKKEALRTAEIEKARKDAETRRVMEMEKAGKTSEAIESQKALQMKEKTEKAETENRKAPQIQEKTEKAEIESQKAPQTQKMSDNGKVKKGKIIKEVLFKGFKKVIKVITGE